MLIPGEWLGTGRALSFGMIKRIATPDTVLHFTSVAAHIVDEVGAVHPESAERAILEIALALFSVSIGNDAVSAAAAVHWALARVHAVSPIAGCAALFGEDDDGRMLVVRARTGERAFHF